MPLAVGFDQMGTALSAGGSDFYIPKVYNGKKRKTFWFFNYTKGRVKPGGVRRPTTFLPCQRTGGFF